MKKLIYALLFTICINTANAQEAVTKSKSVEKMETAIQNALQEKGVDGKLKVDINGLERGLKLRSDPETYQVYVNDMDVNTKAKFFKADIAFIAQDNKTENVKVNGNYDQLVRIPVLAQKMSRDNIIKESDIAWIELPQKQVTFDTITDADKLIGQSLKRNIAEASKLQERDLQKQQILPKNTVVNILFSTPNISIKTVGVALDSGGEGDIIRVRNSSSNKIIQAIIQDEKNVAVGIKNEDLLKKAALIEEDKYVR